MRPVTVKIFEKLLIDFVMSSTVTTLTQYGNGTWSFRTCELFHVRPSSIITINGTEYEVVSVDYDKKEITIKSTTIVTGTTYIAPPYFYFHGTPIDTGNVLTTILDSSQKYPMVYLLEVIKDNFNASKTSVIERESNLNIFFLDEANFNDWDVDQHYSDAIIPMFNLCNAFIDHINLTGYLGVLDNFDIKYHAKFGLQIREESGHIKNLFNDNTSGVQLTINLPFKRSFTCECV